MKVTIVGFAALALTAGAANAGAIVEVEPNDSIATAQFINPANYPANAFAFDGFLEPGDLDFISITVPDAIALTALTVSIPPDFTSVDTIIGIFDSGGTLIDSDDDEGPGDFSFIEVQLTPGTYYIGITGSPDSDFTGAHEVTGGYKLIVGFNIIPAPGALALLGLAGLAGRRRRRH
jgi:uncharacterized protein (TIGR03382 family)